MKTWGLGIVRTKPSFARFLVGFSPTDLIGQFFVTLFRKNILVTDLWQKNKFKNLSQKWMRFFNINFNEARLGSMFSLRFCSSCPLIRVSVQDWRFCLPSRILNPHHLRSGWDIPNSGGGILNFGVYRKPALSIVRTYGTLYVWFTFGYQ